MHIKWAKKEEENSTIRFFFLSSDDYERPLTFLSGACKGIKSVDGSMMLHAAFPYTPNKLWVKNTLVFFKIVLEHLSTLKQHAIVGESLIRNERGKEEFLNTIKW